MAVESPVRLAIDAMSGDHGAAVSVPASLDALRAHPRLRIVLVGDPTGLSRALSGVDATLRERIEVHPASEIVGMDELPSQALRGKRDSSMRVAVNLVHAGEAAACVSAGNTGALMATARYVLKTLPGIDRPAICSAIPALGGHTYMLDLGANADCTAKHLIEFAFMGSALVEALEGNSRPRIGLLNIGEEQIKGTERVKQAGQYLAQSDLNYQGYVEGHHISAGTFDVIVSDGFAGNVAVKTIEGTAKFIGGMLREEFMRGPWSRLEALAARPTLSRLQRRLNPQRYNGASFLGLRGIVVKSHGGADRVGFATAIHAALVEVEQAVPERINRVLDTAGVAEMEP